MTTTADELKTIIARYDDEIAILERRLAMVRQHRKKLYRLRLTAQAQLEREEAPHVKPTGKCVTIEAHDGVRWNV